MSDQSISYFDENAQALGLSYQAYDRAQILKPFLKTLQKLSLESNNPIQILDIGAGTGADAAFLNCQFNCSITAIEPSIALSRQAIPNPEIQWLDDRLPHLSKTQSLNKKFDAILSDSVFHYVSPNERMIALKNLKKLLHADNKNAYIMMLYPTTPTKPHQFALNKEMLEETLKMLDLRIHEHLLTKAMANRKDQEERPLFFEYLILTIKN